LYKNEVFQRLNFGQSIKGYIKTIRTDGKIYLSLAAEKQHAKKTIGGLYKQRIIPIKEDGIYLNK